MKAGEPRPVRLRTGFVLERSSAFSYACRACKRCCRDKAIPITPYDVARLAEVLHTTTTEVLARHTTRGGATLAVRDDGTCVFLGEAGCTVHPGRPLACRLYPLGRQVAPDGVERFAELEPHPQTEGTYGREGTVDDFVRSQGVERYHVAAERYGALFRKMLDALARSTALPDVTEEAQAVMTRAPAPDDEAMLDADAVVARWCAERGQPVPNDVDEKCALHVVALEAMLEGYALTS